MTIRVVTDTKGHDFPDDWDTMPDLELGDLCEAGLPTTGPRRLID